MSSSSEASINDAEIGQIQVALQSPIVELEVRLSLFPLCTMASGETRQLFSQYNEETRPRIGRQAHELPHYMPPAYKMLPPGGSLMSPEQELIDSPSNSFKRQLPARLPFSSETPRSLAPSFQSRFFPSESGLPEGPQ